MLLFNMAHGIVRESYIDSDDGQKAVLSLVYLSKFSLNFDKDQTALRKLIRLLQRAKYSPINW